VGKAIRHDMVFEEHHRVLVVFKDEFGQCNVPYDYEGNPSLVSWCKTREEHTHTKRLETRSNNLTRQYRAAGGDWCSMAPDCQLKEFKNHEEFENRCCEEEILELVKEGGFGNCDAPKY